MASEKTLERAVRKVFLKWGVKAVRVRELVEALKAGNEARVLQLLGVTPETLSPILEELQGSFIAAGRAQLAQLPRGIVGGASFGIANPAVGDYLSAKSARLIQDITQEQRLIVRSVMKDVADARQNPLSAVKQLIGVKGPTGQRIGSVIGLSHNQYDYVANMRREMADPLEMHKYFTRKRRSKLFDATVKKALAEGRPIPAETIDRMAAAYTDNLLKLRAEAIARTEYKVAVQSARHESVQMLIGQGQLQAQDITRVWDATGDMGTRPTHRDLHDQRVAWNEPFVSNSGFQMMYPGDSSLGAPAEEVVNCRCMARIEIDYYAQARRKLAEEDA